MSKTPVRTNLDSAFAELGFTKAIASLVDEIRGLYEEDEIPWVVGYSGGKDSTAVLQLVWVALHRMPDAERHKTVHVISTDTLVENPVVAAWVSRSLEQMKLAAIEQGLPIKPHRLTPRVEDSFWVNLIGKGYPAPRPKFRWCTERLKIKPSNRFINEMVRENGEAILILGTRKAESQARARTMEKYEQKRIREKLSPNGSLPNSYVYSPVEDWSNDDVWMFLMQAKNPWGYNNKDLLTMYQGASPDGECPLVIDSTTPSCGDSRFGCWVCTLVDQDKSMTAMIQNDEEKEWMLPLLELRNELDVADDRHLRDFRRMSGTVQLFHDRPIPGPYTQKSRERWLRKLLKAQLWVTANAPDEAGDVTLVTDDELHEIRRIWVVEKHEFEDRVPKIYEQEMGKDYFDGPIDDNALFGEEEAKLLREACGDDDLHYQLVRELLDIEQRYRTMTRRAGLFPALEEAFKRHGYENEEEAIERARRKKEALRKAQQRARDAVNRGTQSRI